MLKIVRMIVMNKNLNHVMMLLMQMHRLEKILSIPPMVELKSIYLLVGLDFMVDVHLLRLIMVCGLVWALLTWNSLSKGIALHVYCMTMTLINSQSMFYSCPFIY
jgi:hypothetical protein